MGNKRITDLKKELKAESNPKIKKTIMMQISLLELINKGFEMIIKDFNAGSIAGDPIFPEVCSN
jgi:hypothetical protein